MKVCVIDDDDLFRTAVVAALKSRGFAAVGAGGGRAGLALIAEVDAEVAIVDVLMPDMDGLEVIADIHNRMPHVQTIVMSGGGRLEDGFYLHAARDLGANAVISKPFDMARLCEMVRDVSSYAA